MFKNVTNALHALKNGQMILLTDDSKRENEADLVFPAQTITPEVINFMIKNGTGIVCVSLPSEFLRRLELPLIVSNEDNTSAHGTPFTIPVDARDGVTTGVSAVERAHTIRVMMKENCTPDELVRPGHVYPLQARKGGVLERPGHTEGALDIVRLSGFRPGAVICELMNPDGSMAKGDSVIKFGEQHNLVVLSIQELIHYRLAHENQIKAQASSEISLAPYGDFTVTALQEKYYPYEHLTLFKPSIDPQKPLLTRIHSACATGDIFRSQMCDCHAQLHYSLERIAQEGGLLIYLDQEGRGIGLLNKIRSYALQKKGFDTVEANEQLGLPIDQREYYIAAHILKNLKVDSIRLLTSNPNKVSGLSNYGFGSVIVESMPTFSTCHNKRYLMTKKNKLAHAINV